MYYKLDNDEFEKIKEVEKKTCTDYELVGDFIPVKSLMSAIEDLLYEIHRYEEKYNDLEADLRDNYRAIPVAEQVGISERDFI